MARNTPIKLKSLTQSNNKSNQTQGDFSHPFQFTQNTQGTPERTETLSLTTTTKDDDVQAQDNISLSSSVILDRAL